ncbi:MAG: alpha-L-rhamnosidase C-terminal domain-containing protein [Thermoguttaceae bacterium]
MLHSPDWKRAGNELTMEVTVPANTTATVRIPGQDGSVHEVGPGRHWFKAAL